ncbi:MAG: ABC transporter permease subunit, partial [Lachnospiraceae bacterium]|nr:ABC transporter permease subunit [Lachnospiraceae bacterium]
WVLVYAIAFAIFSTDGFINSMTGNNFDYLASTSHLWLKMLAWGMWKGLGWSAIIYIAGISGIDQQLYEAATVDGAGRFQKMLHITVPGLSSTFFVLLLMSIAGILSNGMDQYLVFSNAQTKDALQVLDLYVYNIGIGSQDALIPFSTVVSMTKSVISVVLLFVANGASKLIRGESIM